MNEAFEHLLKQELPYLSVTVYCHVQFIVHTNCQLSNIFPRCSSLVLVSFIIGWFDALCLNWGLMMKGKPEMLLGWHCRYWKQGHMVILSWLENFYLVVVDGGLEELLLFLCCLNGIGGAFCVNWWIEARILFELCSLECSDICTCI